MPQTLLSASNHPESGLRSSEQDLNTVARSPHNSVVSTQELGNYVNAEATANDRAAAPES